MTETKWWSYLQGLMGDQNQQEAAEKAGVSKSNFTRWKNGARADPDFVMKIARAYGVNVLEALVAADFLDPSEAALREVHQSPREALESISDADLAAELQRRATRGIRIRSGMTRSEVEAELERGIALGIFGDSVDSQQLRASVVESMNLPERGPRTYQLEVRKAPEKVRRLDIVSDMPDTVAASDRGPDAKHQPNTDGEESQDPGHDDPA